MAKAKHTTGKKLAEAKRLRAIGDVSGAFQIYQEVLIARPGNMVAIDGALEILEAQKNYQGQAVLLKMKRKAKPRCIATLMKTAIVHSQISQVWESIDAVEEILKIDPKHAQALDLAAQFYSAICQFTTAAERLDALIEHHTKSILTPQLWARYAHIKTRSLTSAETSTEILEEAFPHARKDAMALAGLATTAKQICNHAFLHKINSELIKIKGDASFTPERWINWLRSLTLMQSRDDIQTIGVKALQQIDTALRTEKFWPNYTKSDVLLARARLNHLIGNDHQPDIDQVLGGSETRSSPLKIRCPQPYLEKLYNENADRWVKRFKDRDVFFLLTGPSLSLVEDRLADLAQHANTRFVALNDFGPSLDRIIRPLNATLDAAILLNGDHFRRYEDQVLDLMDGHDDTFLVCNQNNVLSQRRRDDFLERNKNLLFLYSAFAGTPSPENGLTFEFENSLSIMVSFLAITQPKHIFLCGADGGVAAGSSKVHFGDSPESVRKDQISENYLDQLAKEAAVSDEILKYQLPVIAQLFGIKLPEIYTICPTSQYRLFERIDMPKALEVLASADESQCAA